MNTTLHRLAAASLLAVGAVAAHADALTFDGYANGSASINYNILSVAVSGTPGAGGFTTHLNGGPSFVSFCNDLYQTLSFGGGISGYTAIDSGVFAFQNPTASVDLNKLFTAFGGVSTANSTNSAAFQVAVWEIVYETSGSYNLTSGNASFSGDAAAIATAAGWLGALGSVDAVDVTVFHSDANQDVVSSSPIPEPGTYAMMAAGLAAMGFVSLRRRNQG